MTDDERRRHPRRNLLLKAALQDAVTPEVLDTRDVSARGAFIVSPDAPPPGERVEFEISFPGLLAPRLLEGKVRWVRPADGDEVGGFGVEWTSSPGDDLLRALTQVERGETVQAPREYRVLVADDNEHVRRVLKGGLTRTQQKLTHVSFDIVEASDGGQAWEEIQRGVNCVILDIYMPVMDGVQLLEKIRSDPERATLPVVVVSAGGSDMRVEALDAGADFFLPKPLRLLDLFDTVSTLLRLTG